MINDNPYIPVSVEIAKVINEVDTNDIKTFRFTFLNKEDEQKFKYLPGQFAELSIYGKVLPLHRQSRAMWNSPCKKQERLCQVWSQLHCMIWKKARVLESVAR
jgi:NAD(P)H-flavin reductase